MRASVALAALVVLAAGALFVGARRAGAVLRRVVVLCGALRRCALVAGARHASVQASAMAKTFLTRFIVSPSVA
jgi:hypothetical protein